MSYRLSTPSVKRTNVPKDTFVEEPSGTKFVVNNKITIKYPSQVCSWQSKLENAETLLFKAENSDSSLNLNVTSIKNSIRKYRRYLSIEGAYEDDLYRNNYNSKASHKARQVLEELSKMWSFDINYELSKTEIIEELINAAAVMMNTGRRAQREASQQNTFVDMELQSDDDDDSTYVPSVQSDDSEDNRNNVRQMARQRYNYESESDDDDSTYIGSNSSISTSEDIEEYYTRDYEFA